MSTNPEVKVRMVAEKYVTIEGLEFKLALLEELAYWDGAYFLPFSGEKALFACGWAVPWKNSLGGAIVATQALRDWLDSFEKSE